MPSLIDDFRNPEIVGSGTFTLIFSAIDNIDDRPYSVKRITVLTPKRYNLAKREAEIMAKLDHTGIVKYQRTWSEEPPNELQKREYYKIWASWKAKAKNNDIPETCTGIQSARGFKHMNIVDPAAISYRFIQMELCQDYNLDGWLKKWMLHENPLDGKNANIIPSEDRSMKRMKTWFKSIVEAVKYIHSQGIIHNDLRPENIYFSRFSDDSLKVGGFSRAISLKAGNLEKQKSDYGVLISDSDLYKGAELLHDDRLSRKTDIFALGLIFCELIASFESELGKVKAFELIRDQKIPHELHQKQNEAKFIFDLTNPNPEARPDAEEILALEHQGRSFM